jgi:rRNA maturation RNase YbeY
MNRQYLQHDYYTDIITFDYSELPLVSGDLFISVDMVRYNAGIQNMSFNDELHRVMIHGVLHLIGLKDKKKADQIRMRQAEDQALAMRPSSLSAV